MKTLITAAVLLMTGTAFAQEDASKYRITAMLGYSAASTISEEGSSGSASYSSELNSSGALLAGVGVARRFLPELEVEIGLIGETAREVDSGTVTFNGTTTAATLDPKPSVSLSSLAITGRYDLPYNLYGMASLAWVIVSTENTDSIINNTVAPSIGIGYRFDDHISAEAAYRYLKASGSTTILTQDVDLDMDLSGFTIAGRYTF